VVKIYLKAEQCKAACQSCKRWKRHFSKRVRLI